MGLPSFRKKASTEVKAYLGFADEYYQKMKERITMIDLCIFDFDNTLLRTDDLKFIREQGKKRASDENYRAELKSMIGDVKSRLIYLEEDLQDLRAKNPTTKFALFSLAPMAYLEIIDNLAFPDFFWDDVVCYESIYNNKYKPSGFGIEMLMERNGILDASRVVMVGDSIKDISAAYNAGCYAVLDKSSWPRYKAPQHWSAIKLIPDLIINKKNQLDGFLKDPTSFLPAVEYLLSKNDRFDSNLNFNHLRFDRIKHFAPVENLDFDEGIDIYIAGRLFSNYDSLESRRRSHDLTGSVYKQKDSEYFEESWLYAVLGFIKNHYNKLHLRKRPLIVSAIPDRPGRTPRQRALIKQLSKLHRNIEVDSRCRDNITFTSNVLSFKESARSNSGERLSFIERFDNLNKNLFVIEDVEATGNDYLIIDDVVTTGASLMYARKKLKKAGARNINLLAFSKTVTDLSSYSV